MSFSAEHVRHGALSGTLTLSAEGIFFNGSRLVSTSKVSTLITDVISNTLLVTQPLAKPFLFTFVEGGSEDLVSSCPFLEKTNDDGYCRMYRFRPAGGSDDFAGDVFDAFARVKTTYTGFAKRLLGIQDDVRPRREAATRRNPWIVRKAIDLPESLYLGRAITEGVWRSFHDKDGAIASPDALKTLLHRNGCAESVRRDAWMFLLGMRPAEMSDAQFSARLWQWQTHYAELKTSAADADCEHRIDKDVHRVDRQECPQHGLQLKGILLAYCKMDPEVEYVQGMCDLLVPIVTVVGADDEAVAFQAFLHLMRRVRGNFVPDSPAIQRQLDWIRGLLHHVDAQFYDYLAFERDSYQMYFCYRWLLVLFKREFDLPAILRLWDVLLAAPDNYHVFIALAHLYMHREEIMESCHRFEDILSYFNRRAGQWRVDEILAVASQLHQWIGSRREARQLVSDLHQQ